ncbi:uncharacterized protein LOC113226261 [Hyposmocoma kahamanoa]|uniref:uncharacterized protein LOC113226261 n=1 Tax=Hyposmocoma kahamanoa TaxID=1477025 RepID=UPI000E6D7484|nr:uncharacterized protein LOC113226261 [Hyposmocoma kahamanoa]
MVEYYLNFAGKSVIVTGASSGIGAATAIMFAEQRASVTLIGRNETKLNAVAKKLPNNATSLILKADVTTDAKKIIDETVNKFGKIDVLVNNAGFAKYGGLTDGKFLEAYDALMRTNMRAVAELTMLAVPHLAKTKGNIINTSSIAANSLPFDGRLLPYYVSKAALDHFTRGAAMEFAPKGIRVNSVNPGPVLTNFIENAGAAVNPDEIAEMTALKRFSTPEEIAELILYLASDKAQGMTGSLVVIDNGWLLRP